MKINILIALCLLACGCKKTLEPSNALKSPYSADVAVNAVDFSKFKVVVRLHPSEDYFPMEPVDFIKKSRFRHERSGSDEGYNKNSNKFVRNNSHNSEYYDIPVNVINGYGLESSGRNRRPKDDHKGDYNVFLEPDDNLQGDHDPNTRVSSFLYTPDNVKLQYWLFYGYNYSNVSGLSFSHQGDWESVTLNILNDTIEGAWLSAHGDDKYYDKNALEISIADFKCIFIMVFGSIAATQPANANNPYYSIALGGTANLKDFLLHPTASFTSINDRARSGKVSGTAGRTITVFDSPDGKTNDDYTVIQFKTTVTGYYLDTFEKNYEDSNVKVTYVRKNGLDGKVSAIRIQ